jgi:hypothetical protein
MPNNRSRRGSRSVPSRSRRAPAPRGRRIATPDPPRPGFIRPGLTLVPAEHPPKSRWTVPREELVRLLYSHGYIVYDDEAEAVRRATDQELRVALGAFHKQAGLLGDGWAGPATYRGLTEQRFCALPDVMPLQEQLCKWQNAEVPWSFNGRLGTLPDATVKEAFEWAWGEWAKVCKIKPFFVPAAAQAKVIVSFGRIDGASGTLAWSELPCGADRVRRQLFDSQEAWVLDVNPARFRIDLGRVACHEIGHVLGLPHLSNGNLMQPMYDPNIRTPQAGDITEVVARYGKPDVAPPPPPPPPVDPGGEHGTLLIEFQGRVIGQPIVPGFRVQPA